MPTENRSNNTDAVSESEMTECQFHNNCGGWCETRRELQHNLCEHCLEAHEEEIAQPVGELSMSDAIARALIGTEWADSRKQIASLLAPLLAAQHQPEPGNYPPCDYCGTVPSYHPWHGSGLLNGVESRHIHACDGCRGELPAHPGQHQGEPVHMVRTHGSDCWEEISGESLELCQADTAEYEARKLYTRPDTGEVERLRAEVKRLDLLVSQGDHDYDMGRVNFDRQLAERDALLREANAKLGKQSNILQALRFALDGGANPGWEARFAQMIDELNASAKPEAKS